MSMRLAAIPNCRSLGVQQGLLTLALLLAVSWCRPALGGPLPSDQELNDEVYAQRIEPLLARYCQDCHGGADAEAEL